MARLQEPLRHKQRFQTLKSCSDPPQGVRMRSGEMEKRPTNVSSQAKQEAGTGSGSVAGVCHTQQGDGRALVGDEDTRLRT